MKFLQLEQTLNILAGYSPTDGPLYNSAGAIKSILTNDKLSGEQKAQEIKYLILESLKDWKSKGNIDFTIVTPREIAQALDKSEKTIIRMCQEGEMKNARRVGSGKNSKWVIVLKS